MSASELTVERLLRAHAPHAPETLRERVLALESAPQRRNTPSRRLVLVALPAALAIAVLAAVVHGVVGSGSPRAVPANKSFSSQEQGSAAGGAATSTGAISSDRQAARRRSTERRLQAQIAAATMASGLITISA